MTVDDFRLEEFLRELSIFTSLDKNQRRELIRRVDDVDFHPGDRIISQGDDGDFFFIIFEGQVSSSYYEGNNETHLGILVPGDFFGEEAILYGHPSEVTVTALTEGTLIYLDKAQFLFMLDEYPKVKTGLIRIVTSRQFAKKHKFDWLGENEVIYQVRRKHPAYLLAAMIAPLVLMIFTLLLAILGFATRSESTFSHVVFIIAGILLFVSVIWSLWIGVDWANDYYIVTNRRVVWIERIMWIYESRIEAPLDTILSVNVTSSYIGRILGYGNVIVCTFTGQIPLRIVGEPQLMGSLIEEHWHRAKLGIQIIEDKEIERSVQQLIGRDRDNEEGQQINETQSSQAEVNLPEYQEPSLRQKYFSNIFAIRIEEGKIITFRKHWISLLKKSWLPLLAIFLLLSGLLVYDSLYITGQTRIGSPLLIQSIAILILLLLLLPWWLYNYIDWRNDIYQVTEKSIFDIERKPFGKEVRKSALLENILSLEHERPGFIGYIFNYGNVTINVGEAKFIFNGVFEPARVQQDIFDRMYMMRQQKEQNEIDRERDRILAMLSSYHRNMEDFQH